MRNISKEALILTSKTVGENNRLVTWLSKEDGILTSVLYGGPKSKNRSLVSPWNSGILYLYNDESKHSSKINDFDVKKYHPTFRESLFKSWAANLASEIVIETKCGGSFLEVWTLLNGFLDGLDLVNEEQGQTALIRFLWRYLGILGVQCPEYECAKCGKPFYSGNLSQNDVEYKSGGAIYSQAENGFICNDCSYENSDTESRHAFFTLSSKAVSYLEATSKFEPQISRRITLSGAEVIQLKALVYSLIESACGKKLKSLQSGIGIL